MAKSQKKIPTQRVNVILFILRVSMFLYFLTHTNGHEKPKKNSYPACKCHSVFFLRVSMFLFFCTHPDGHEKQKKKNSPYAEIIIHAYARLISSA